MTKKHLIGLASALRGKNVPPDVMESICDFCSRANPNFNRQRFLDYAAGKCGPNGGKPAK